MADRHPAVRIVTDHLARLKMERDNARAIARILAHSYVTDNRPPKGMAEEALKFPVLPQKEPIIGRIVAVIEAVECSVDRLTGCLSELLIAAERLNGKHHCARCPVGPDDPHPEYNPECHLRRTAEDARSLLFGDGS